MAGSRIRAGGRRRAKLVRFAGWVVAVGLFGLLGYMTRPSSSNGERPGAPETAITRPPSTTSASSAAVLTALESNERLDEMIPGLEGTLVAVVGPASSLELVEWPTTSVSPRRRALPTGASPELAFEAGITPLLAFLAPSPTQEGATLYVGTTRSYFPVAEGVSWFAWHNTRSGQLAWSGEDRKIHIASVVSSTGVEETATVGPLEPFAELVAWDSSGFLVFSRDDTTGERVLRRLDLSGQEVARIEATEAYLAKDNYLLLARWSEDGSGFEFYITGPNLDQLTALDWAPKDASAVAWSPLADRLAFIVYQGSSARLEVWSRDGDPLHTVDLPFGVWDVEWSHDGRFLLMPGTDIEAETHAVLVYDQADGSLDQLQFDDWVYYVDVS
jgi:hypothetical protein